MNRYVSYEEVDKLTNDIIKSIMNDQLKPQIVVGISRGGLLPAIRISNFLDIPMECLRVNLRDNTSTKPQSHSWLPERANDGMEILIVDDINDTGATINWILDDWCKTTTRAAFDSNINFATLFSKPSSYALVSPTYIGEVIDVERENDWIIFPWEK